MEKYLKGKTAVITGAGGLLGPQHAAALLELGATVCLTDINLKNLEDKASILRNSYDHSSILTSYLDVTEKDSIESVRNDLQKSAGIDILINNAAVNPKVEGKKEFEGTRFEYFSLDGWNSQLKVGLTGAFLCSQVFGSQMVLNGGGVILNIASDLSVIAPDQRIYRKQDIKDEEQPVKPVSYSVVKTGLIGLTRYLAAYWASKNVRVNALSPGGVFNDHPEEFVTRLSNLIPMGRMARKDEYRQAVQFLCSDASSYMTGQNLVIDGGRSIL